MKKIKLICTSVLVCTLVFVLGTNASAAPAIAVTNASGSTLFKLYYKSATAGKVKVSIKNENNETVFHETLMRVDAFIRPYNFNGLPEGQYTVTVEDESGKAVEKISYEGEKIEKLIHISKLADDQKYLLTVSSPKPEEVYIYVFDESGALVHNEIQTIDKQFAKVYNLKNVKSFSLEIWDKHGELKRFASY
ncbi:MAG: hypothetical protein JST48_00775 [Bacteroidetes bacterium]|nr:hypothetical protein [Bacteroidota bacterium]